MSCLSGWTIPLEMTSRSQQKHVVPSRVSILATGFRAGCGLLIINSRNFLSQFLESAQHQALIGQGLFGSSIGPHRFWFSNHSSNRPTILPPAEWRTASIC